MYASTGPIGGAQIEFSLPRVQVTPSVASMNTARIAKNERVHVLLVEDENVLREAMTEYLSREHFDVSTAASIREAIVHLETGRIDGLVSDYSLKDQTADGLMKHIEVRFPDLLDQILLISGGFRGEKPNYPVMMKPFALRDLKAHLGTWQPLSHGVEKHDARV